MRRPTAPTEDNSEWVTRAFLPEISGLDLPFQWDKPIGDDSFASSSFG